MQYKLGRTSLVADTVCLVVFLTPCFDLMFV